MDSGLNKVFVSAKKGGVLRTLPFFALCVLAAAAAPGALRADPTDAPSTQTAPANTGLDGNVDFGARLLYTTPSELNDMAQAAGFPKTGGLWLLWGGGATLTPNPLRVQLSAWKGSLSAASQSSAADWGLNLAALSLEQAYTVQDFLLTGGADVEGGELQGSLIRAASLEGVSAALFGYGLHAGVRWPAQTPLAFYLEAGWELLYGPGVWHGGVSGADLFELGGPTATLQVELSL